MPVAQLPYSSKRIDKSGRLVRKVSATLRQDGVVDLVDIEDELLEAIGIIEGFRAAHARPLARVNAGLRYYVKKAGMGEPVVTQRLKRFGTIVDKLRREPNMALSKMEDIGGVRAVLESQDQANAVRDHLVRARKWDIRRVRTYVDGGDPGPKGDGYRAIHIIVRKDGCFVEIQLRTPWQDTWAQSVEKDMRRLREGLKFGVGPDDLRTYYRMISELFAMRELHVEPEQEFMEDLAKLYAATRRYFEERGKSR